MDAQFDTGTFGSDVLYLGKDLDESVAVFWYGLLAGIQSFLALGIYMITKIDVEAGFRPFHLFVMVFVGIWSPTFFTWLGVVIFDSVVMRQLFSEAVHISVGGPFGLYWLGMADLLIMAMWDNWGWWLTISICLVWSLVSILYQAVFVPKVENWIQNEPILTYEQSQFEKDNVPTIVEAFSGEEEEEPLTDEFDVDEF